MQMNEKGCGGVNGRRGGGLNFKLIRDNPILSFKCTEYNYNSQKQSRETWACACAWVALRYDCITHTVVLAMDIYLYIHI